MACLLTLAGRCGFAVSTLLTCRLLRLLLTAAFGPSLLAWNALEAGPTGLATAALLCCLLRRHPSLEAIAAHRDFVAYEPFQRRRKRMAPFAVSPSTMCPLCVMTIEPSATSARAATRTGSISGSHAERSSPATSRATSLGQIVLPGSRSASNRSMAVFSVCFVIGGSFKDPA
jgi:hypothetical protein